MSHFEILYRKADSASVGKFAKTLPNKLLRNRLSLKLANEHT
jgi:hypothetical protein